MSLFAISNKQGKHHLATTSAANAWIARFSSRSRGLKFETFSSNLGKGGVPIIKMEMSQLLLLGKFEYGGEPIFKVVLEC